jgi:NAD+ synthase
VDSRQRRNGSITHRRRECVKCGKRFSTKEVIKGMNINYAYITNAIRDEAEKYLINSKRKSVVLGLSGGIDSTLCCALIQPVCEKLGVTLIGRSISIESNKPDEIKRAEDVGIAFCGDFKEVDLTALYYVKRTTYELEEKTAMSKINCGNLKARTRMEYLYWIARKEKGMVLSTDNLTEYLLGFWTLHGDIGDFGMIQKLWKSEVYNLTEFLKNCLGSHANGGNKRSEYIPMAQALNDALYAIPTDGLGISNSDLDQIMPGWEMEFDNCRDAYARVDIILQEYLDLIEVKANKSIIKEKENNPVIQRHLNSEFKRNNPYNIPREVLIK